VVMGPLVHCDGGRGTSHLQTRGRERAGQPETGNQAVALGFGSAISNGAGERRWVVVGQLVRCDGGCGILHLPSQGGGEG
jgi:hypothetical protein